VVIVFSGSVVSALTVRQKKTKSFVSWQKKRTFASRLLSKKDKQLIHSELIDLCPGRLAGGEEKHLVVTF